MGNSCCFNSRITFIQNDDDLSEILKVETIVVKPTDASGESEYAFNGATHFPKISSDSSF